VPFSFTRRKLTTERLGDERSYLDGKSDIHEADLDFQQRVKDMYLFMAREANLVSIIDCSEGEAMLAPTVIFEKIRESLKTNGIIR
jgi:dTMP kinase